MPYSIDPKWRDRAACRDVDIELFYPPNEDEQGGPAKAICAVCPVQRDCLEWAILHREKEGIWGGATARERQRTIRRRREGREAA